MSLRRRALDELVRELVSPAGGPPIDVPTFQADPLEVTRRLAKSKGLAMTEDELRVVSSVLVQPVSIRTWYLIARSQHELEISGLDVARPAFRYAITMHTVMVLLGLSLLGSSLAASVQGSTQLAAVIGALGLGAFVALFLVRPLKDLYGSLGTRVQLEIIGLSHQRQIDLFRMYARMTNESDRFEIDEAVLPLLNAITERTLSLVENLGKGPGALEPGDSEPSSPDVPARATALPTRTDRSAPARERGPVNFDSKPAYEKTSFDKVPLEKTVAFDKPDEKPAEGRPPELPRGGQAQEQDLGARVSALEELVRVLIGTLSAGGEQAEAFIGSEERPDLTRSALSHEDNPEQLRDGMRPGSLEAKQRYDSQQ